MTNNITLAVSKQNIQYSIIRFYNQYSDNTHRVELNVINSNCCKQVSVCKNKNRKYKQYTSEALFNKR